MTWRAMTKAASGVACAMLAEFRCRSGAHCLSAYPRQLEPSVGRTLLAAVRPRRLSAGGRFPGLGERGQRTIRIANIPITRFSSRVTPHHAYGNGPRSGRSQSATMSAWRRQQRAFKLLPAQAASPTSLNTGSSSMMAACASTLSQTTSARSASSKMAARTGHRPSSCIVNVK